jgi:PAS domain S-box-containing protein
MTPHSATGIDRITRCALCKIDLKGRFVFIDDLAETLLGYTKEELFGKTFKEFLSESDQELFFHVMRQQRTYETSFDSLLVTLITPSKPPIPANIIVTLGFIAGNPVNFQIIIQLDQTRRVAVSDVDESPHFHRFISTVLSMNGSLSLPDVLEPIREFMGAIAVGLYRIAGDKLETVASAPRDIPVPTSVDVHRLPALLGRLSKLSSEPGLAPDQVQRGVIESTGDAPSEYFSEFELNGQKYLVRIVFDNSNGDAAGIVSQRTTLALSLVCRLLKTHDSVGEVVITENDFGAGLALFDSLGIGALFVRPDGTIAAANHCLVRMCEGSRPNGRIDDIIAVMSKWGGGEAARNLSSFFDSAVAYPPLSWKETVALPGGGAAQLTAVRHSASQSDASAWLVISPIHQTISPSGVPVDPMVVNSAVEEILASLNAASTVSDRLTHEFYDELHRDGNLYLSLLHGHMDKLRGMVSEFGHLMNVWLNVEETAVCDLNLIVAGIVQELSSTYPETVINCRFSDLSKIQSHRNRLTQVVRNLMSNAVKYSQGGKADIQIAVRIDQSRCTITIKDAGPGIPQKYLGNIFAMYYRIPLHPWQKLPGDGSSLAITRQLVRVLGGNLTITSEEGRGTSATIELPNFAISNAKPAPGPTAKVG